MDRYQAIRSMAKRQTVWIILQTCLMAPSSYLNQSRLIIKGAVWHSSDSNLICNMCSEIKLELLPWHHGVKSFVRTTAQQMLPMVTILKDRGRIHTE